MNKLAATLSLRPTAETNGTITAQSREVPILVLANDNDSRSIDVTNSVLDVLVWACLLLGAVPGVIVAAVLAGPAEALRWMRGAG